MSNIEEPMNPLNEEWYLLGQPWVDSVSAGYAILAGSEDPHIGTLILDMGNPFSDDEIGDDMRLRIASHIVRLHNAYIKNNQLPEDEFNELLDHIYEHGIYKD